MIFSGKTFFKGFFCKGELVLVGKTSSWGGVFFSSGKTMSKYVGVERDQVGLEKAFDTIRDIYLKYQEQGYDNNSLITSLLIIKSAVNRTEQRGSHYRTDHPYQDNKLNSRSSITKEDLNL